MQECLQTVIDLAMVGWYHFQLSQNKKIAVQAQTSNGFEAQRPNYPEKGQCFMIAMVSNGMASPALYATSDLHALTIALIMCFAF
jgi:hypothetical protein